MNTANKIVKQLKKIIRDFTPDTGVVLGSGWGSAVDALKDPIIVRYSDLKDMPKPTVKGHTGNLVFGTINNKKVMFVQGRFHLYEGHSAGVSALPIKIMKLLGVKNVIITNAAGSVNESYNVGDIVVVNNHLNFTGKNPLTGVLPTDEHPVFIDMSNAYSALGSKLAYDIVKQLNIPVHYGTYMQLNGPNYETSAEIKMARVMGADLVGMSTVMEVIMATYLKLNTVCLSCVTNKGAGMERVSLSHSDVLKVSKHNANNFKNILIKLITSL